MITVRLFIGTNVHNKKKGSYTVHAECQNDVFTMPSQIVSSKVAIDKHRLILLGLIDFLNALINICEEQVTIKLYITDDILAYEWNVEHLQEKSFSDSVKDLDLWNKVINIVNNNKYNLCIFGSDNMLSSVSKMRSNYGKKH